MADPLDDQPVTPAPDPASPAVARAALREIIERMTDDEAVALWRLICAWVNSVRHNSCREDVRQS
jgi:hypothetical protein